MASNLLLFIAIWSLKIFWFHTVEDARLLISVWRRSVLLRQVKVKQINTNLPGKQVSRYTFSLLGFTQWRVINILCCLPSRFFRSGTYRYMAPEVFRHETYSEKVDTYSFAMLMYFLTAGHAPWPMLNGVSRLVLAVIWLSSPVLFVLTFIFGSIFFSLLSFNRMCMFFVYSWLPHKLQQ